MNIERTVRTVRDEALGNCADCRCTVVFIDDGTSGWRFCLGCMRRGPDVRLASEVPSQEEAVVVFEFDDQTVAGAAPPEVMAMARRERT